jgi:hypothetical protein
VLGLGTSTAEELKEANDMARESLVRDIADAKAKVEELKQNATLDPAYREEQIALQTKWIDIWEKDVIEIDRTLSQSQKLA